MAFCSSSYGLLKVGLVVWLFWLLGCVVALLLGCLVVLFVKTLGGGRAGAGDKNKHLPLLVLGGVLPRRGNISRPLPLALISFILVYVLNG